MFLEIFTPPVEDCGVFGKLEACVSCMTFVAVLNQERAILRKEPKRFYNGSQNNTRTMPALKRP